MGLGGHQRYQTWAALMQRAFGLDVLACPRCGGRLRLIATICDPRVAERLVTHLARAPRRPGQAVHLDSSTAVVAV